jgi:hypothetical protein
MYTEWQSAAKMEIRDNSSTGFGLTKEVVVDVCKDLLVHRRACDMLRDIARPGPIQN